MKISEPVKSVVIETWVWLNPAITFSSTAGAAEAQSASPRIAEYLANRRVNVRPSRPW